MSAEVTIFLVRSTGEPDPEDGTLWWSNEDGWATLGQALVYTEDEAQELAAPLGGEWVRFTTGATIICPLETSYGTGGPTTYCQNRAYSGPRTGPYRDRGIGWCREHLEEWGWLEPEEGSDA